MRRVNHGAFATWVLSKALNESNFSLQDRRLLTDLVYGSLRHQIFIDACLKPRLKRPDSLPNDVLSCLRLGGYEILIRNAPRHAVVNEWVEVCKKKHANLAGLVNAVLRRVDIPQNLSESKRHSIPDWLYQDWKGLFQQKAVKIAQHQNEPEPLWLYCYHPEAADDLVNEGCEVNSGPVENTLAIRPSKSLHTLSAYQKGWVQPQNPSSSLAVGILNPKKGELVYDLASGNGIKTAQLAFLGTNPLSIEISSKKVKQAKENLARLKLNAQHKVHDLRTCPKLAPASNVLLDAPCSGTGTLRGHPEIRNRIKREDLKEITALQKKLLETAFSLTISGGKLVYAVCALTQAEGPQMIKWLVDNFAISVEPFTLVLPEHKTKYGSFILPYEGLDGFFIARLKKH